MTNSAKGDRTARLSDAPLGKRLLLGTLSLAVAAAVWLPSVHLCFRRAAPPPKDRASVDPWADRLAGRHLHLWTRPELRQRELDKMRASNAEWDFMGRSYLVWALANMSLRNPKNRSEYLAVMDRIIDETVKTEREQGLYHFLMPYAQNGRFVAQPPRSLFLDGEIALMLAVRRMVEEKEAYRAPLRERVDTMVERMQAGPVLCAESYPDECWMFCNSVALAAIRIADHLDGTDHSRFFKDWIATARKKLVDPETGLLVSSFTLKGHAMDGPEGSSIWMVAHCLRLIDPQFARQQYEIARRELGRELCGFGYAREWPAAWQGRMDIDSGPVIPVLNVSAGSSGCAFIAARSFDDAEYFRALRTTIDFAGFPHQRGGRLRYCASNQVGDAVLLYAAVLGRVWQEVQREGQP